MWRANPTDPASPTLTLSHSSYLCNLLLSHWTCAAFAHSDWPHTHTELAKLPLPARRGHYRVVPPPLTLSLHASLPHSLHTLPCPSSLRVNTLWQFSSVRWLCSPFNKVNCDDDDPQNTHEDNSSATPTKAKCVRVSVCVYVCVCVCLCLCVCDSCCCCCWQHFS